MPEPEEIARRLDSDFANWAKSLTFAEKAELRSYQGVGYLRVNPLLRDQVQPSDLGEETLRRVEMAIDAVDSAIAKGQLQSPVTAYRGLRKPAEVFGTGDLLSLVGKEIPEDAFVSTSIDPDVPATMTVTDPDPVIVCFRLAISQRCAWLSLVGDPRRRREFEVLLPRRIRWRIEGVSDYADIPMIEATVIQ